MTTIPYRLANGDPPDADKFMADYDWLASLLAGSFVQNGGFEAWAAASSFTNPVDGTTIADNWTWRKSGTSSPTVDVSREATIIDTGTYAGKANITGAGSSNSLGAFDQVIAVPSRLRGETVLFGAKVRAATGSKVRLRINDGTTSTYSSYHSGGGTFELLQVVAVISATATTITVSVEITSDFTGAIYADSVYVYVIPPLMSSAARAFLTYSILFELNLFAGDVVINAAGKGLVVTTPDGLHTYRIYVANDGQLSADQLS